MFGGNDGWVDGPREGKQRQILHAANMVRAQEMLMEAETRDWSGERRLHGISRKRKRKGEMEGVRGVVRESWGAGGEVMSLIDYVSHTES